MNRRRRTIRQAALFDLLLAAHEPLTTRKATADEQRQNALINARHLATLPQSVGTACDRLKAMERRGEVRRLRPEHVQDGKRRRTIPTRWEIDRGGGIAGLIGPSGLFR